MEIRRRPRIRTHTILKRESINSTLYPKMGALQCTLNQKMNAKVCKELVDLSKRCDELEEKLNKCISNKIEESKDNNISDKSKLPIYDEFRKNIINGSIKLSPSNYLVNTKSYSENPFSDINHINKDKSTCTHRNSRDGMLSLIYHGDGISKCSICNSTIRHKEYKLSDIEILTSEVINILENIKIGNDDINKGDINRISNMILDLENFIISKYKESFL